MKGLDCGKIQMTVQISTFNEIPPGPPLKKRGGNRLLFGKKGGNRLFFGKKEGNRLFFGKKEGKSYKLVTWVAGEIDDRGCTWILWNEELN